MMHKKILRYSACRGFTLFEMAIASTIAASLVVFSIYWIKFNAYVDQGRSVGQQYLTLNDAVNNYLVTYSQALAKIDPTCSETTFALVKPTTISQQRQGANCSLQVAQGKIVANGFQPTASELLNLGFISPSPMLANGYLQIEVPNTRYDNFSGSYVVEADPRFPNGNPTVTYLATAFRLFINIELTCLQRGTENNPNTNPAAAIVPLSTGCPSNTTTAFKSLIFNTQKYIDKGRGNNFGSPALFASIIEKIGSDALSSGLSAPNITNLGNLFGKNFWLTNPIRVIDTNSSPTTNLGLAGIIAMRGGYGASYAMQHSRTDGSNPPTADWSFGAHNLNDVNILNSTTLNASGNLTVGNTASVINNLAAGSITSPTGTITNLSATGKMHLPIKILGNACDPNTESISVNSLTQLLLCQSPNNIWSTQTANSGTIDFSKYFILQMSADINRPTEKRMTNFYRLFDCVTKTEPLCSTTGWIDSGVIAYNNDLNNHMILLSSMPQKVREYFPVIMQYRYNSRDGNNDRNIGLDIEKEGNLGDESWKFKVSYVNNADIVIRLYKINP